MFAPFEAYKTIPHILGIKKSLDQHVSPDFSDYELDKYLSPNLVLPYLVSHGCKWGKCNFCSHKLSYSKFVESDISDVIDDISNLVNKYNVKYISFSDEYLTAKQLDTLSDLLNQRQIKVKWSTFIRAENKFSDFDFAKKLYDNGGRLLMCGFESLSQKILNKMKKGTDAKKYIPILKSCKEANIAVRLDFMIGFPGETAEEIQDTFSFIKKNKDLIDTPFSSCVVVVFELKDGTPIMLNYENYNINIISPLRGNMDEQYAFIDKKGLSDIVKYKLRKKIIIYLRTKFQADIVTPNNKTHQLIFKDLFDKGHLRNTVTEINSSNIKKISSVWNDGVIIKYDKKDSIKIINYATGGIIELSPDLYSMVKKLEIESPLHYIIKNNMKIKLSKFIKIINFLYRNDYLRLKYNQSNKENI